jgi:Bacterial SH3 domain
MRSVRCDACGTKALLAASQCPKCGHLFDMRDGFGELLPLAYCSMCESYYPESLGACRWCGTKPEPESDLMRMAKTITPQAWKGVGIAALLVVVLTAWILHDSHPKDAGDVRTRALRRLDSIYTRPNADSAVAEAAPADTMTPRMTIVSAGAVDRDSVTPAVTPTVVRPEVAAPPPTPPQPVTSSALEKQPVKPASTPPSAKSRTSSRWVASVAKGWVVVRAGPSKSARIIASVGPNSRVQLGESNGTWRRLRTSGIAGWVEPGSLFVASPLAPKPRSFVSR